MEPFSFRWINFRGFADTGWVEIKPLTVILGPNNSGKSSLLAPLLLMKQTLDSADVSVPLMAKGPLLNVGSFRDLVTNHDESRTLTFELRFHHHEATGNQELKPLRAYPPAGISVNFRATKQDTPNDIELSSYRIFDVFGRPYVERKREARDGFSLRFYPVRPKLDSKTLRLILAGKPEHFIFTDDVLHDLLREVVEKSKSPGAIQSVQLKPGATLYFSVVATASLLLRDFLERITYLGPLREPPKRLYEFSGETPKEVGLKGEFAPEIFARRTGNNRDDWIQRWIRTFDYGGTLVASKAPYDSFFLEVKKPKIGPQINLADMGFGLSQVLPLIVTGAYSSKKSVLLTEQPEIHLNPKLQCILADLFVEMANSGRGVIVETHSEHLLLRLRRLIAEKKIEVGKVAILFVERNKSESIVRNIPMSTNGHIPSEHWPKGFFEESLREALGLASSQSGN